MQVSTNFLTSPVESRVMAFVDVAHSPAAYPPQDSELAYSWLEWIHVFVVYSGIRWSRRPPQALKRHLHLDYR